MQECILCGEMTKRKFYKTLVQVEILSEEPIPEDLPVEAILQEATNGSYSARDLPWKQTTLNGKQAAKALQKQGSDPSFFQLTTGGNDTE